ncbi:MAG TPA: NUDIX hydrolase [Candidatus Saccharimonadales bacterium]
MKKVAVGVVSRQSDSDETEYLLVSSAKDFGEYTGYYYPPGGHVEEGEDVEVALVREIAEELNLTATIVRPIAITPGDVADQETYWYECTVEGDVSIDPELRDARYFTQSEIENGKVWPATQKVFQDYIFQ